jgi:hypothetical protein
MNDPKVSKPREAGEPERPPSDADDRPVPLDEPTEPTPPVDETAAGEADDASEVEPESPPPDP